VTPGVLLVSSDEPLVETVRCWIKPALGLAEKVGTTDPRRALTFCLCGKNGLLDGPYQRRIMACTEKHQGA